ncbi:MAG: Eco29kI family restriction endonuclease [Cyanobacteria bacterium J06592_8]
MIDIFRVPPNLSTELLNFSERQNCYELRELEGLKIELREQVGVYILYYQGAYPLYTCISQANSNFCCLPLYVGKAVAGGRRMGKTVGKVPNIYSRLREHCKSIEQGEGIEVSEFKFKVVAMEIDLVSWGEGVMIRHFQPIWNQVIDGFGNHDPGRGRYQQKRSVWDTIHPGRTWADRLVDLDSFEDQMISTQVEKLCRENARRLGCM